MASGATVGTAIIKLSFDGKDVKAELNNISNQVSKSGKEAGSAWGSKWTVAAGNLISQGISKLAGVISGGFGKAISRIDSLNNFPKVMTSLGYSADEAESSVSKISDALDGLPTTLDGAVNDIQKLAATMGNLDQGMVSATSVGLALNDMFLAGGKGTEAASMAMEQYNQMLANGKVDMQSWRSMVNAAPGQMDQLAKSLLGAEAGQAQLYEAMQKGTISFDQFNEKLVQLDKEGGASFASFNEQAVAATGGLETQLQNISTSLTKFIGASIEGDTESMNKFLNQLVTRVSNVAPQLIKGFANAVTGLAKAIPDLLPVVLDAITETIPSLVEGVTSFVDALVEKLPEITQSVIDLALAVAMGLIENLPQILTQIVNGIMQIVITLTQPENLQKILQAGIMLLMSLVKAIPDILVALIEALPQIITGIVTFLTDPANIMMIIEAAVQLFFGLVEAVPRILGALLGAFGTLIGNLWDWITQKFGEFAANFGNFIGDIFKGAINGILTFIENFINSPIDVLNGFIGAINWAFGFIGVNLDPIERIKLPRLAQGGIAVNETLAMIGEDGKEAVIPLENNTDNWAGMLADILVDKMDEDETTGTSGRPIEVNMVNQINNEMDAQDIGRVMMQSIRRAA